jgi:hypothetical protein
MTYIRDPKIEQHGVAVIGRRTRLKSAWSGQDWQESGAETKVAAFETGRQSNGMLRLSRHQTPKWNNRGHDLTSSERR